jgi:hypothetical protein
MILPHLWMHGTGVNSSRPLYESRIALQGHPTLWTRTGLVRLHAGAHWAIPLLRGMGARHMMIVMPRFLIRARLRIAHASDRHPRKPFVSFPFCPHPEKLPFGPARDDSGRAAHETYTSDRSRCASKKCRKRRLPRSTRRAANKPKNTRRKGASPCMSKSRHSPKPLKNCSGHLDN